jgi:protein involved in polysaccharide export with SLBB domain
MNCRAIQPVLILLLWAVLLGFSEQGQVEVIATLAPGNQLQIASGQDASLRSVIEINWEGDAQLPLCGKWRLAGMMLSEFETQFKKCLASFYRKIPEVRVQRLNPLLVAVRVGERGGTLTTHRIHASLSLSSFLAKAGFAERPDRQVRILTSYGADFFLRPSEIALEKSLRWKGGETVLLEPLPPESEPASVDVLGEVRRPGPVRYRPALSVFDVFREVQGPTPQAVENQIVLIRATTGERIETHWNDRNTRLEPGDALLVPAVRESHWEKGLRVSNSFLSVFNALLLVVLTQRKRIP